MTKSLVLIATICSLGLAACTDNKNRIAFDGQFFRAKVSKVDKQRDVFVVTVRDPGKSIEGARLAAHYEGVSYCLENYGTSEVIWSPDPMDETVPLRVEGNELRFGGKCPQAQRI